jgi:hypothetical protein
MQQPLPQTRHSLGLSCFVVFLAAVTTVTGTSAGSTLGAAPARAGQAGSATPDPFFQDGLKITPSDEAGAGQFGTSLALSADGTTALVGGPDDGNGPGAAWVFTRTSSGWSEQAKLMPTGETGDGQFGSSVAVSADGNTAPIGAPQDGAGNGAAWVFTRSGSTWAQQGEKLVDFGTVASPQFKVVSANEPSAVAPPSAVGSIDVTMTSLNGTSVTSSADLFTYTVAATKTTTTSSTTTIRSGPKPPTLGNPLSVSAIRASVLGHGKGRQLDVMLRASDGARLQVELLARKSKVLSETFSVVKGANNLVAPLPPSTRKGTDLLQLILRDSHRRHRTYTTTVKAPS